MLDHTERSLRIESIIGVLDDLACVHDHGGCFDVIWNEQVGHPKKLTEAEAEQTQREQIGIPGERDVHQVANNINQTSLWSSPESSKSLHDQNVFEHEGEQTKTKEPDVQVEREMQEIVDHIKILDLLLVDQLNGNEAERNDV